MRKAWGISGDESGEGAEQTEVSGEQGALLETIVVICDFHIDCGFHRIILNGEIDGSIHKLE